MDKQRGRRGRGRAKGTGKKEKKNGYGRRRYKQRLGSGIDTTGVRAHGRAHIKLDRVHTCREEWRKTEREREICGPWREGNEIMDPRVGEGGTQWSVLWGDVRLGQGVYRTGWRNGRGPLTQ